MGVYRGTQSCERALRCQIKFLTEFLSLIKQQHLPPQLLIMPRRSADCETNIQSVMTQHTPK